MHERFIHYRRPLWNTYHHLMDKKELRIVYFGGSVTNGHGSSDPDEKSWRALSAKWFQEQFPDAKITAVKSAIGESGTFLGTYRLQRDVISQKPDLLFIEYAINDFFYGSDRETAALQYETIIREVKQACPDCDIVTLITDCFETAAMETLYPSAQGHEKIAEYYGIATVLVGKALIEYLGENLKKDWSKYYIDIVHPTDAGYARYFDCLREFLEHSLIQYDFNTCEKRNDDLPPMKSKHLLDGNRRYEVFSWETLRNCKGFYYSDEYYLKLSHTPYQGYICADKEDAELIYTFCGTEVALFSSFHHESEVDYSLDGGVYRRLRCDAHNPTILARGIGPGEHTLRIRPVFCEKSTSMFKAIAMCVRDESLETKKQV